MNTTSTIYLYPSIIQLFPFYPEDETLITRVTQLLSELDADKEKVLQSNLKQQLDDLIRARDCRALALQK